MKGLSGRSEQNLQSRERVFRYSMKSTALPGGLLLAMILLFTRPSLAQGITGSISGTVTDSSGATISGAMVTIRELGTNAMHTVRTSDVGSYRVPQLSPGAYSVKVVRDGFQPSEQDGITLAIDQGEEIDIKLEVGSEQQTVNVTSEAPVIQPQTAPLLLGVR